MHGESLSRTFGSIYAAFVEAADLAGIMKDLKPFAEVLLLAEPRGGLLGRMGSLSEMK